MNNKNKKLKFNLILVETMHGEVSLEYVYKSYFNVNIAIKMREHMQSIIDKHDYITIKEERGFDFNEVRVEVEYAEE